MNRYEILLWECECPKCNDSSWLVYDCDLECEIGEFDNEADALEFVSTRKSQDVINRT